MKKILIVAIGFFTCYSLQAQEFNKQVATARSSYSAGKLDDSRFAMQQALQEIDLVIAKEVLKILPQKMDDKTANVAKDEVSGGSGLLGVTISRDYGTEDKNVSLQIINNSPMLAGINQLLSLPLLVNSADSKVVKINNYKALVNRVSAENDKYNYELQLPLNTALITLKAPGYTQDQVIKMANTLPIAQIAKMVQ